MRKILRKLRAFFQLDSEERNTFFMLLFYTYYYKIVVAFLGYRFYKKHFQHQTITTDTISVDETKLALIKCSVKRVNLFIFWEKSFCLVNALAVGKLCRRFQLPYQIHLGGRKADHGYEAHAWLTVLDIVLVGDRERAHFSEIGQFKG